MAALSKPTLLTCSCNNCDGHLEFEAKHVGKSIQCPHCGMATILYVLHATRTEVPAAVPPLVTPATPVVREGDPIFLEEGGILVSKTRFVVPGRTFDLANITSVSLGKLPPSAAVYIPPLLAGLILLVWGAAANVPPSIRFTLILSGVLMMVASICVAAKPSYVIILNTAGGEIRTFTTTDHRSISRVVEALNAAIVAHG